MMEINQIIVNKYTYTYIKEDLSNEYQHDRVEIVFKHFQIVALSSKFENSIHMMNCLISLLFR